MRINDFEPKILGKGLVPVEVKLERNAVKWFVCHRPEGNSIVVFDEDGKAWEVEKHNLPDNLPSSNVIYYSVGGLVDKAVVVNGKTASRKSMLDLIFD